MAKLYALKNSGNGSKHTYKNLHFFNLQKFGIMFKNMNNGMQFKTLFWLLTYFR